MTAHGGPRYDAQWADVIDAEKWAELRRMAEAMRRAYRVAAYFPRRETR
jgi:hypothetical protein